MALLCKQQLKMPTLPQQPFESGLLVQLKQLQLLLAK